METSIGCSVVIYDRQGKVLISQRSAKKKCFPLLWELIGGGLEDGETPEQCIRREAIEEIGCELHELELFDVNVLYDGIRYLGIIFTAMIHEDVKLNEEIIQVKWISENEIENHSFMTDGADRLTAFFKSTRSNA